MGDGFSMAATQATALQGASGVLADSALAMFLIGLAVGVPSGIGLFFTYLILREKQETEQDRQMDELLASLAESGADSSPWSDSAPDGRQTLEGEATEERRDPWERPTDWWRHAEDDA
jgi:hypothetical protein